MNLNELTREVERLRAELANTRREIAKRGAVKKARAPIMYPAMKETRDRCLAICKEHGFVPSPVEVDKVTDPVEKVERRLREKDPGYRYHAQAPVRVYGVKTRAWTRSGNRNHETGELTLFAAAN